MTTITILTQPQSATIVSTGQPATLLQVGAGVQGPPGPQGPSGAAGATLYPAGVALSGHTAIVLNAAGLALPADPANPAHHAVAGITAGAATAGNSVEALSAGVLEHLGWAFTPGLPVFLGQAGAITQTLPPDAVFSKALGISVSPTRISIDFQPAIFK